MEVTRCSTVSLALSYLFCGINAAARMRARETKGGYSLPMLKHIINHARKRAEIRIKRSTAASSLTPETETDTPTDNAHDNDIDSAIPIFEKGSDKWPFGPYPRLVFYMGVGSIKETYPQQGHRPQHLSSYANNNPSTVPSNYPHLIPTLIGSIHL